MASVSTAVPSSIPASTPAPPPAPEMSGEAEDRGIGAAITAGVRPLGDRLAETGCDRQESVLILPAANS